MCACSECRSTYSLTIPHQKGLILSKEIRILVKTGRSLPLSELNDLQGELKSITSDDLTKLKKRILEIGFCDAVAVWNESGTWYILNGHQRRLALLSLEADGSEIPEIPVIEITADNYDHARKILLSIEGKYGTINRDNLRVWLDELDEVLEDTLRIVDTEINLDFIISEVNAGVEDDVENSPEKSSIKECPSCGHRW